MNFSLCFSVIAPNIKYIELPLFPQIYINPSHLLCCNLILGASAWLPCHLFLFSLAFTEPASHCMSMDPICAVRVISRLVLSHAV